MEMQRNIYRIIDANFNRAREAIRVIEEFCRFALNSESLSERAKGLRHELCAAIGNLDSELLICSRDTERDVGVGQKVDSQLKRGSLEDCFVAACKRLIEALRVLSETTQILDRSVAESIENLRYAAYTLEKDITIFSSTSEKFKKVRLYVIINSSLPADIIRLTNQCIAGGADCLQLRAKGISDDKLLAIAREFCGICRDGGAISIINDRVDIAVCAEADGVHLGQNNLDVESARRLELSPLIIGKSTHSVKELCAAIEHRPTYVALGPVFPTRTKPGLDAIGLDYIKQGCKLLEGSGIRGVAIGGMTVENVDRVLRAGVETVAVCSAVTESGDPEKACRTLKETITAFGSA